jgi:alpha-ketoglutarate-dependent taurine dioxygenase
MEAQFMDSLILSSENFLISYYKKKLEEDGYIHLENNDREFNWMKFSKDVTECKLLEQYHHGLIFQVKSQPQFLNLSDAKSQKTLLPHTEASDYKNPPKFLVLWCKMHSSCGGGATTLVDIKGFLQKLTEAEKRKLMQTQCFFGSRTGVHKNRTPGVITPILSFSDGKPNFRYSYNLLKYGDYSPNLDALEEFTPDPFVAEIAERFLKYFEDNHFSINMKQNSLLLWDNRSMVHSRTAYIDPARELKRIFLG